MSSILRFLAPYNCLSCGDEGKIICDWCRADGVVPLPSRCYRCHKQTDDFATCDSCRHDSMLKHVWISGQYKGIGKALIHKLKFERSRDPAEVIANWIADTLPFLPPETVVSYVPTATNRRRQRGYDQSELVAKSLADQINRPFEPLLARRGQTRQVGASRKKRLEQLSEAFRVLSPAKANGQAILLVDDIVTTGATLETAARALKKAGAKTINAAVFAQKR